MTTMTKWRLMAATAAGLLLAALAGALPAMAQGGEVNVYSSRHYDGDKKMFARFTELTGIKINVVEADIGPLMQRLQAEGRNSPADLLVTVDAGNLWRAKEAALFQPIRSAALEETIPAHLRDPEGHWFGLSQRARVILFHKDRVKPEELSTYEALAEPKWKGRILVRSSSNVYNQSLIASIIAADGPDKAEAWAKGLVANFARVPKGGDTDQIKALAAGEGDIAISNTYYYARLVGSAKPEERAIVDKIGIFFPNQNDRGTHMNISGAGVTRHAPNRGNAIKLLEFLTTPEAQQVLAEGNYEYPVRPEVATAAVVNSWGRFKTDGINLAQLGKHNPDAVRIADRAGWR